MTHKLQVKEHLHNSALYQPVAEPALGGEWKRQLFCRHNMHTQLSNALRGKTSLLKRFVCIGVPIACIALVFTAYFGFSHPERWFENIVPVLNFNIPPIGLKEIFIFAAAINGLTFFIRKRAFAL